jgi:hypothetical protein
MNTLNSDFLLTLSLYRLDLKLVTETELRTLDRQDPNAHYRAAILNEFLSRFIPKKRKSTPNKLEIFNITVGEPGIKH